MPLSPCRHGGGQDERHLLGLSGLIAGLCLMSIPYTPGPVFTETLEVIVPLGISIGVILFTLRLRQRGYDSEHVGRIVRFGWIGTLIAVGVGGWWITLHLYFEMPLVDLADQILTVVSGGLAAGTLLSYYHSRLQTTVPATTGRMLAETSWTHRSDPEPITAAIVEVLSDLERVDALELDPIYEYVDPDTLDALCKREGVPWTFWVRIEGYDVCISSLGSVTVYDATGEGSEPTPIQVESDGDGDSFLR